MWPENYSANSAQKVWAAKFAARHPERRRARPVVVQVRPRRADLRLHRLASSSSAKTPYAALHDIDANKPGGSIKIRVKTYAHSLKLHEERLEEFARRTERVDQAIASKRVELLRLKAQQVAAWGSPTGGAHEHAASVAAIAAPLVRLRADRSLARRTSTAGRPWMGLFTSCSSERSGKTAASCGSVRSRHVRMRSETP